MKEAQYVSLKKRTDFALNNTNNCCKKGCSFCCYQLTEVLDFEKQTIKNAINILDAETKIQVKNNLESWTIYFNKNTPDDKLLDDHETVEFLFEISIFEKHQCPLLIDNCCAIYNNRPLACRLHLVKSDSNLCEEDAYRASSDECNEIRKDVMKEIKTKGKHQLTYLPYIIAEVIPTQLQIKPIKRTVIK